jgi:hypothetical protein
MPLNLPATPNRLLSTKIIHLTLNQVTVTHTIISKVAPTTYNAITTQYHIHIFLKNSDPKHYHIAMRPNASQCMKNVWT